MSAVRPTRRQVELDRFGGPEVMRWVRRPTPPVGPDEVAVEIEALGVNFGDSMVRRGEYRREQTLDFTPGFESVGRIVQSAPGAPPAGAKVAVFTDNGRGYADLLVVPVDRVYEVPEDVPAEIVAALLIQGTTAWYSLHRFGAVSAGDTVLVNAGAGGVGSLTIQLARAAGAEAIATASSKAKLEIARGHGAGHALLADPDTLATAVRGVTDGRGVDIVVDGVGGKLVGPCMAALGFHGRYVVTGAASQEPGRYDLRGLMPRNQSIHGFVTARIIDRDPNEPRRAIDAVLSAWSQGQLKPTYEVLGPEQIAFAHEQLESRKRVGKLVIDLTGASPEEG